MKMGLNDLAWVWRREMGRVVPFLPVAITVSWLLNRKAAFEAQSESP
ncbi:hypothetical protein GGR45_003440 [Sphingomonas zeae]|jgi:hypothetical protein|nr:hypothetical protein [Sphingomonas zeae]